MLFQSVVQRPGYPGKLTIPERIHPPLASLANESVRPIQHTARGNTNK